MRAPRPLPLSPPRRGGPGGKCSTAPAWILLFGCAVPLAACLQSGVIGGLNGAGDGGGILVDAGSPGDAGREPKTHLLTYDSNGATGGSVPASGSYETGAPISVAQDAGLVKAGYTFAGWNTKADGMGTNYAAGSTLTMGTADIALYAVWIPASSTKYALTYDANGASGAVPASGSYAAGSLIPVSENTGHLVNDGQAFCGWNTKADGTGTSYAAGSTLTMGSASVTLYAVWGYTLTYSANGATSGTAPSGGAYPANAALAIPGQGDLAKSGFSFNGWNVNAAGTGTNYSPSQTFTMPATPATLYAHWVPVSPEPSSRWTNVLIGGGGYVPGIIYHPTTANLRYARTDIGGVYRWDHAKAKWIALADGFGRSEGGYDGAESLALDPTDPNKVYMTTGQYVWAGNGRLYYSSDQGATWAFSSLPFPVGSNAAGRAIGERLAVDPNLPSTLYCASRSAGLWKSTDRGLNWAQVSPFAKVVTSFTADPIGVEFVVFDTSTTNSGAATQTLYAGIASDYVSAAGLASTLYKTTNGGATWSPVTVPTSVAGLFIPHMVRASDGMLYAAFTSGAGPGSGGPAWLYKFDGNGTWTLLKSVSPTEWTSWGFGGLSVSGSGPSTKIALGVTNSWGKWDGVAIVFRSADDGNTWTEIGYSGGDSYHTSSVSSPDDTSYYGWIDDVEIDPFNPDHVSFVFGGGIWSSTDAFSSATPSWTFDINGIEETCNLALMAPPPGASYLLLSGQGDVGSYVHTSLSAAPTRKPTGAAALGNGSGIDMAWNNPATIVTVGVASSGSQGAYSTDSGQTWKAFASRPPVAATNSGDESTVAVTADGANVIWAIHNAVPYYTTDNGASWTATDLPELSVVSGVGRAYHIAADRKNPKKVYAYDHGGAWWSDGSGKVYSSTDGGHTFTASSLSLKPNMYNATWLAVNPNAEGDVWLADANNLYHSTDSGVTWTRLTAMATVGNEWTQTHGATLVALGKPAAGATYSAAIYLVGTIGGIEGLYRSDDMGANWTRINDNAHQFGGIGRITADNVTYGRVYVSGGGRGILYND
jgi:xyloglucan-specific exo-beta-1,4-glucanase